MWLFCRWFAWAVCFYWMKSLFGLFLGFKKFMHCLPLLFLDKNPNAISPGHLLFLRVWWKQRRNMIEAQASRWMDKGSLWSISRHHGQFISVRMGGRWSGSFHSTCRNQRSMEAQNNLIEFHLKADGNSNITLARFFFLLLLFPQTTTIPHVLHARNICMCPRECSPFAYSFFTLKIGWNV